MVYHPKICLHTSEHLLDHEIENHGRLRAALRWAGLGCVCTEHECEALASRLHCCNKLSRVAAQLLLFLEECKAAAMPFNSCSARQYSEPFCFTGDCTQNPPFTANGTQMVHCFVGPEAVAHVHHPPFLVVPHDYVVF